MISVAFYAQEKETTSYFDNEVKRVSNGYLKESAFAKAHTYFLQKEWDSTLVYSMEQLTTNVDDKALKDLCLFFRGYAFKEKGLLNESKTAFLGISEDFTFYNQVKLKLGTILLEEQDYKNALTYFKEIEQYSTDELLGIQKDNIEENIGLCYMHLEQFDKAESYLNRSIALKEARKDTLSLIGSYGNIANLYYVQYKDTLAIPYFEKAYTLSKGIKHFPSKSDATFNMAIVEENRENMAAALMYRKEYEQWKDSLNDQNKVYEVAQMEKEFAVKQKQKEVSLLEAENKIKEAQKDGLLYSSIILLALLGTGVYFYREKVKTNKIIVAQKENLDELNATKDKLFSIVSHDLRSSVHALKASNSDLVDHLEAKNLEKVNTLLHSNSAIVNGAYNLLDNLLNWALLQTKQSYFEITELRLFFIVEQVAHNYKALLLEKKIHLENAVLKSDKVYADQESLKIILRNIIDNAIKFSNPEDTIKIYTQATREGYCDLVIEDTGIGMSEATRQNLLKETIVTSEKENKEIIGSGLGMQLCKSMIKKNHGEFFIESTLGKGTKMIVSLAKIAPNG
ncbi:ATP-binding protein [uncultured Dokdonia sp.]|uniref:tetratricopeptide repeat-containing sensor histidine kinase n=1 Tax=uncultured Dokdonia sp. TaxID=575653 RepID=UPI00262F5D58|nr:ATP-binding protein [uncultured Dokdonia sp.]